MDSRITKGRLSNFFSYEWIILIIVTAISIVAMELLYTVLGVRLTVGQQYKVYFDQGIYANGAAFTDSLKFGSSDSVFSYDVLDFSSETLTSEFNVLSTRLTVYEGDAIITHSYVDEKDKETPWKNRANEVIDTFRIIDIDNFLKGAGEYLNFFIKDGKLDNKAIENHFLERMKGDNRFRSNEEKRQGIQDEIKRFERLLDSYTYLSKAFEFGKDKGWFYSYKKYTYTFNNANEEDKKDYQYRLDKETEKFYGINVGKLSLNKKDGAEVVSAEEYFNVSSTGNALDTVLMIFDFTSEQPDLQYESISVLSRVIQNCTGYNSVSDFEN